MKKSKIIILSIVSIFILFVGYLFFEGIFTTYRTTGSIKLEIDGEKQSLNNIPVVFDTDFDNIDITSDKVHRSTINKSKFKFYEGGCCNNSGCIFVLPPEITGAEKDITVSVNYFIHHHSLICKFNIDISIDSEAKTIVVSGNVKEPHRQPRYFEEATYDFETEIIELSVDSDHMHLG